MRRDPLRSTTDREVDVVLGGRALAGRPELDGVARFAAEVRTLGDSQVPQPVGRLAELLDAGLVTAGATAGAPPTAPRGRSRNVLTEGLAAVAAKLGEAAFVAKTGAGVAVALTAVTGAAAADVLPQQLQDKVATVVETVTPADVPDSKDAPGKAVSEQNKHQGRDEHQKPKASPSATPTSIATPVATTSPDSRRTGRPASPGQQGLDQANSGPAAGHAPTAVPRNGNGPGSKPTAMPTDEPRPTASTSPKAKPSDRATGKPASPGSQGNKPTPTPTRSA